MSLLPSLGRPSHSSIPNSSNVCSGQMKAGDPTSWSSICNSCWYGFTDGPPECARQEVLLSPVAAYGFRAEHPNTEDALEAGVEGQICEPGAYPFPFRVTFFCLKWARYDVPGRVPKGLSSHEGNARKGHGGRRGATIFSITFSTVWFVLCACIIYSKEITKIFPQRRRV